MPEPKQPLLSYEEALARLLALGTPTEAETLPLMQAGGRRLAAPVQARLTQPPADMSAMDGYAIRFADLGQTLKVIGEAAAGHPFEGVVHPGEAVRIFTGAYIPTGADTVAVQEDAVRTGDSVHFPQDGPPHIGAHIRKKGLDFQKGQVLAQAGDILTPARLGLLAASGLGAVPVHRKPRIALLSTGDELVPIGQMPKEGQIIGANGLMIQNMLSQAGADVTDLGLVPDNRSALIAAIQSAKGFDLLVTIGGASVGDHDLVKPCLEACGAQLDFWKVAIRPGKPLMAGTLGDLLVIGLPGNPVSAHMTARIFLWPLIAHLTGQTTRPLQMQNLPTTIALPANGPRRHFMRARIENGQVTPFANQDSSLFSILAQADALIVRAEHAPAQPAGSLVPILPF